ncbi:MAG: hypothetical protein ACKO2G_00255 [Verrucomicrobiales bacterium]
MVRLPPILPGTLAAAALLLSAAPLLALPNSVFGPVAAVDSPLNGVEMTDEIITAIGRGQIAALRGEWKDEGAIGNATMAHLLARPKLFGREVVLARSLRRGEPLESVEATFADAGSFFGYLTERPPEGREGKEAREEWQARLLVRQTEFQTLYSETLEAVKSAIASRCGGEGKTIRFGRSRDLRAEPLEWRHEGVVIRLFADGRRLVRVHLIREGAERIGWLDPSVPDDERARLAGLAQSVEKLDDGTVHLPDLQPIPQGFRPYCGLNALAISARHFGLHVDEDWLAVAGKFENTGSAGGSDLLGLYQAVANEAGLGLDRGTRLDAQAVKRAIDAGFPVVVWRRFSYDRDKLHNRFLAEFNEDASAKLPDPTTPGERATWPGKDAPLHASVITGYHQDRREFLFLESWTGRDVPRRMRAEEMIATCYLAFVFKP